MLASQRAIEAPAKGEASLPTWGALFISRSASRTAFSVAHREQPVSIAKRFPAILFQIGAPSFGFLDQNRAFAK